MSQTITKRRAPSVRSLVDAFRITEDEARTMRAKLQAGRMADIKDPGFYGVEYVRGAGDHVLFSYLNTGDTYAPTIVRRSGSDLYRVSTMGDEVEALERAGVKVQ